MVLARLAAREPHAVVVSARTGVGIDALLEVLEHELPRPSVDVDVLLPYSRGDLVSKIHQQGEVLTLEHVDTGSRLRARVNPSLAGELAEFAVAHALD
jgi:GTPase